MKLNALIVLTLSLASCFHIPDVGLTSGVDIDDSVTNTGLINSQIKQNWSQTLNVGSASLVAILIILFLAVAMHLGVLRKINHLHSRIIKIEDVLANKRSERTSNL